jgi:hypothetical protein
MRPPAYESQGFQVGDDHGRVGRVDSQRLGKLAHRHRLAHQSTDCAGTAEADAHRLGDLAPSLVVEHEVGHQQPDLA